MRPILEKAYGNLYPVTEECYNQAYTILSSWNIEDAVFLEKDMLRFSYEGDYFPCDEIAECLRSFHTKETQGKLDCMNIEDWTLTRHSYILGGDYHSNTATLNKALEKY